MTQVEIREERGGDEEPIANLLRAAFPGEEEAALVERLRRGGEIVASLVAERSGVVVGYLAFSRTWLKNANGRDELAWLAPVAVDPEYQNIGVGSSLIKAGLLLCGELGVATAIVLGDPSYYARFGFSSEGARGLESRWAGDALMAIDLQSDRNLEMTGELLEPVAFEGLE